MEAQQHESTLPQAQKRLAEHPLLWLCLGYEGGRADAQ